MKNSDILGIKCIIFQPQFNGFVRCFLDGNEKYEYYSTDDFIKLADNLDNRDKILFQLEEALSESSFFLWDVDNSYIRRMVPGDYERENVFTSKPYNFKDEGKDIFDSRSSVGFKNGKVTVKKFKLF